MASFRNVVAVKNTTHDPGFRLLNDGKDQTERQPTICPLGMPETKIFSQNAL